MKKVIYVLYSITNSFINAIPTSFAIQRPFMMEYLLQIFAKILKNTRVTHIHGRHILSKIYLYVFFKEIKEKQLSNNIIERQTLNGQLLYIGLNG